jgi:hypothetical protein
MIRFSDPNHILPIMKGDKKQTTRLGEKAAKYTVGKNLNMYYKEYREVGCHNCIKSLWCGRSERNVVCSEHTNNFGTARILKNTEVDLCKIDRYEREKWAIKDGFKGFEQADDWFLTNYGDDWLETTAHVIEWNPAIIVAKWSEYLKFMDVVKHDETRFRIRR